MLGARHAVPAACRLPDHFNAVVDCWGGRVVMDPHELTENMPVSPSTYLPDLKAAYLGIYGNNDENPTPEKVNELEAMLVKLGKEHSINRFDDAGHGFFYYDRPAYRPMQAMQGWALIADFSAKHLGTAEGTARRPKPSRFHRSSGVLNAVDRLPAGTGGR